MDARASNDDPTAFHFINKTEGENIRSQWENLSIQDMHRKKTDRAADNVGCIAFIKYQNGAQVDANPTIQARRHITDHIGMSGHFL